MPGGRDIGCPGPGGIIGLRMPGTVPGGTPPGGRMPPGGGGMPGCPGQG